MITFPGSITTVKRESAKVSFTVDAMATPTGSPRWWNAKLRVVSAKVSDIDEISGGDSSLKRRAMFSLSAQGVRDK